MIIDFLKETNEDGTQSVIAVFGNEWFDTNRTQILCFCYNEGHVGATQDYLKSLPKADGKESKEMLEFLKGSPYYYSNLQMAD